MSCNFCDLEYLVIAKLETFNEDQKFVSQLFGLEFEELQTHQSAGGSTKKVSKDYFSMLDENTVERLYNFYKIDFEMFGYSFQEYLPQNDNW